MTSCATTRIIYWTENAVGSLVKNRLGWSALPSRRGWYYQQLVKLLAYQRIDSLSRDFLLWDADNVLVRDYAPFEGAQTRFIHMRRRHANKGAVRRSRIRGDRRSQNAKRRSGSPHADSSSGVGASRHTRSARTACRNIARDTFWTRSRGTQVRSSDFPNTVVLHVVRDALSPQRASRP